MPQNGINARGISALADAFAVNKQLSIINLSDNTFTAEGSVSMAAVSYFSSNCNSDDEVVSQLLMSRQSGWSSLIIQ